MGPDFACVTKRLKDANGLPIGTVDENPILDTRVYEVEYVDGHKSSLTANAISQNMLAQIDNKGNKHVLFGEIIDHHCTALALKRADSFIVTSSDNRRRRETNKVWDMLIQWKDGSTTWVPLKDMKESYPFQVSEYAVLTRIQEEPTFVCWFPHVLLKRNRIVVKVKSKYCICIHKFGLKMHKAVTEAISIDCDNGDILWWDAISKEMKKFVSHLRNLRATRRILRLDTSS